MKKTMLIGWMAIGLAGLTGCGAFQRFASPRGVNGGAAQLDRGAAAEDHDRADEGSLPDTGARAPRAGRKLELNGHPATARDLEILELLEGQAGQRLPNGSYWYDPACGAAGPWGGPTLGFLPAGLALGGPLPASASGGGNGRLTGVFVNGREVPPADAQHLGRMVGRPVAPGRYFIDAAGNAGYEGGPVLVNLVASARSHAGAAGDDGWYERRGINGVVSGARGCTVVRTSSSGSSSTDIDAFIGCD